MEVMNEVVGGVDYDVGVKGQRTRTVKMSVQLRREAPRTHDEEGEARAPAPQPQAPVTSYLTSVPPTSW